MDQELADAAAYALSRRFVCTQQMAVLFCVKWPHGHHLASMTSCQKSGSVAVDVYLLEEHLPNFVPIRFETMEPWRSSPQQQEEEQDEKRFEVSSWSKEISESLVIAIVY